MTTWWCSFVDKTRPEGSRFVGVILIPMSDGATVVDVARHLWRLGINPGGELLGYEWSDCPVPGKFIGRLLTKAEAAYVDRWMANTYPDHARPTPDELRALGTVAGEGEQ